MNIVFSKHARERMQQRLISEELVLDIIQRPDRTYPEDDGDTKFIRRVQGGSLHVVCKPLPAEDKWLVKSVWFRPANTSRRPSAYRGASSKRHKSARDGSDLWLMAVGIIVIVAIVLYGLTR